MGKAVLILLTLALFGVAYGINDAPHIRILEIRRTSESLREVGEHVVNKPANSYVVVGEDIQSNSKVIFECDAHYPVQWVYTGSGMPEYFTNTSSSTSITRPGPDGMITRPGPSFTATLSLGVNKPIGPEDSGKYICRSSQNPALNSFYYLHDKEAKIFSQPGGTEIQYKRTDQSVLIPCSVSMPDATVSLQKSVNGLVTCPLNESIKYDPSRGFDLKVSTYFDPAGVYICTAGFKDTFQVTRYTLIPMKDSEHGIQQFNKECLGNQDCESDKACMRINNRQTCTSPCPHVCGRNTRCETVNNVPRCYCLSGFAGDPYQTCSPQVPESNTEDPCSRNPCGHNTRCDRYGNRYTCSCLAGFQGDPYVRCYQARDACSPNPCGANTDCVYRNGYATCICRPGYYGTPPNCRTECEQDQHCTFDKACMRNKCQNPCVGACDHLPGTRCHVVRRIAVCSRIQTRCRDGYYGRDCQSIYTKDSDSARQPEPIPVRISAISADMPDAPTSPCSPSPCGSKAECLIKDFHNTQLNMTSQIAYCQCVPNYTGNADIECYPVEEQLSPAEVPDLIDLARDTNKNATQSSGNSTVSAGSDSERPVEPVEPKNCGINAISIISDGVSSCSCPEGFTGIATIECHQITNNADDENGINGTNVNACNPNPCGRNTNCISNADGVASCECIRPFEGNPWVGCELNCTKNEECPETQVCNEPSQRCVNPCDPEYQPFFTQCGRNAACKVKDHIPYCFCSEQFPHGSPHIHCKEEAWMPNHLKYNSTCENSKKLNCGNNSSCKRFHDTNEYCVCLPGFFGDPYVEDGCKLGLQCAKNDHCKDTEECMNGKCLDVCRNKETCGKPNEGCIGKNHTTSCICHIGTIFNPKGECEPMTGALAERLLFFRSFEDI